MRILSIIITLSFIFAASAYCGEKRDRNEAKDKPAAAQSDARQHSSAPASTGRFTPSATPPAATAHSAELPRASYQTGTTAYSPRSSSSATHTPRETTSPSVNNGPLGYSGRRDTPAGRNAGSTIQSTPPLYRADANNHPTPVIQSTPPMYRADANNHPTPVAGYRPGSPNNTTSHTVGNSSRTSPYLYKDDRATQPTQSGRHAQVAEVSDRQFDAPSRQSSGSTGYTPLHSGSSSQKDHGSPGASHEQGSSSRPSSNDRDHSVQRPSSGNSSHDGARVYSTGYSPHGTTYTVGYHRPTKIVVPKSYSAPSYRQGHYYYQPTYHPKPCYYGHWAFDYDPGFSRRSIYFNFGVLPYVQITRISECSYVSVSYVSEPIYISGASYYDNNRFVGLDDTLADIRSAWVSGRFDLIEQHVRPESTLAVLLDGKYDYGISSADYLAMTHDAISDLDTVSFVWDSVREKRDGTVTAFGQHSYRSAGQARNVFVSYTFKRVGHDYYLTEVGSSLDPLN